MATGTPIWRLKKGEDRRIRAGHPWVYSNELQGSPKGIEPGAPIVLHDAGGKFLAAGYGNPSSLIAFRVLSRSENDAEGANPFFTQLAWCEKKLKEAWAFRDALGLTNASFRWVFGENDGLPGLVIDRFLLTNQSQVVVLQAHTAGIDRMLPRLIEAIEKILAPHASGLGIVIRNDLAVRKLEGIPIAEPLVHRALDGVDLTKAKILVRGADGAPQEFLADLAEGQKTGFFLDQSENVRQIATLLSQAKLPKTVRILDLCCYVGQWSAKLAQYLRAKGHAVETTLLDASADALVIAKANAERAGAKVSVIQGDVLEDLGKLPNRAFDLVISDPPAFIKGRKDIPQGTQAYLKMNTEVFRVAADGAWVVACSCSQLLEETELMRVLAKASARQNRSTRWIARGTQAMDHPARLEFPEGKYLKMWVGKIETTT